MKRSLYQKAIDENGANRKLREEIGCTDLDALSLNERRNPARHEWVKLAVTLALLGLSAWLVVWLLGRHG